jgi:hypothetical protein
VELELDTSGFLSCASGGGFRVLLVVIKVSILLLS